MKKIWQWLQAEAREEAERLRHGEAGLLRDARTGLSDTTSEEGRLRLRKLETEGILMREALHVVRLLSSDPPESPESLAPFLQSSQDGLVVETLAAFARWRTDAVLPDLLLLYRTCPTPHSRAPAPEEGDVLLGHPDKRRPRPSVFRALERALLAITGRRFDSPESLAFWLDERARRRPSASPEGRVPPTPAGTPPGRGVVPSGPAGSRRPAG